MRPLQSLLPESTGSLHKALCRDRLAKRVCAVSVFFLDQSGDRFVAHQQIADGHRISPEFEEKLKLPDGTLHIQFSR